MHCETSGPVYVDVWVCKGRGVKSRSHLMVRLEHKIPALARLQRRSVPATLLRSDARRECEVFGTTNESQKTALYIGGKVPINNKCPRGIIRHRSRKGKRRIISNGTADGELDDSVVAVLAVGAAAVDPAAADSARAGAGHGVGDGDVGAV